MGAILEAIRRFSNPEPVAGGTVIGVALVGIRINTATAPHVHVGPKGRLKHPWRVPAHGR